MTAAMHIVFGTGPAGRAVATTVDLFRAHATAAESSNSLAEATTLKVTA
jgi:hypothetical protein